tara:strand:+ start:615 stop:1055 length:441 start_codon:yes stop_codon:yes gene_type:complete
MSFAIIETGGKQYKVAASNILKVEKLNITKGSKVEFKKVLLVNDDKTTEVGNPTINGATVEGLLLENIKDKKIIVFKKRRRQNSRKRYGHRQLLSKVQITKILKGGKIVSEIKENKMKLSNEAKSDKKKVIKKSVEKRTSKGKSKK